MEKQLEKHSQSKTWTKPLPIKSLVIISIHILIMTVTITSYFTNTPDTLIAIGKTLM
jgi:hypothetical protein